MPDGTSGTSSHLQHERTKVVRIHTRSLMYPLMLHPVTPVRSLLRTCPLSDQEGMGSASQRGGGDADPPFGARQMVQVGEPTRSLQTLSTRGRAGPCPTPLITHVSM